MLKKSQKKKQMVLERTCLLWYQVCHWVFSGRPKDSTQYLDPITGTLPSVSPLLSTTKTTKTSLKLRYLYVRVIREKVTIFLKLCVTWDFWTTNRFPWQLLWGVWWSSCECCLLLSSLYSLSLSTSCVSCVGFEFWFWTFKIRLMTCTRYSKIAWSCRSSCHSISKCQASSVIPSKW